MGKKENERSTNDAVCTPPEVYEPVLKAMGIEAFDLDPCSHPRAIVPARMRVLLPEYRALAETLGVPSEVHETLRGTVFGDGLARTWGGDVWKNPPYSQLQYAVPTKKHPEGKYPWLHKAAFEATRCASFLPSRTASAWWHWILRCERADILVQLKGRVTHVGEKWGSPFHQVVVGFGMFDAAALEPGRDVFGLALEREVLARWRDAFGHPHKAFVSSLREARR